MNIYLFFFVNVLAIALPLAIFEIVAEKSQGWGSGWQKNKWYAKPFFPKNKIIRLLVKILTIESPLNYHILVFVLMIPSIFILEYFLLTKNILLLASCFIGVLVAEDFLWFLLNWNFDSLKQLLKGPSGSIWWHKRWFKISLTKYLPTSYFYGLLLSLVLLFLAQI